MMWEKISKIFGHLASKNGVKNQFSPEYFDYSEYVPQNISQRRAYLRIQLYLPLNFWRIAKGEAIVSEGVSQIEAAKPCVNNGTEIFPSDENLKKGLFQRIQTCGGMGLNLSGSGVLIISSEEFSKGDFIEINDKVFGRQMSIYARVIRSTINNFDNSKICEFAVEFIGIKELDRDHIVRSIFDKVKILKKINRPKDEFNMF